jgi:hypothetical protein
MVNSYTILIVKKYTFLIVSMLIKNLKNNQNIFKWINFQFGTFIHNKAIADKNILIFV